MILNISNNIFTCLSDSMKFQMVDSKLSAEGNVKLAEMSGDPAKVKNAEAVNKECIAVGGGDRYVCNFCCC